MDDTTPSPVLQTHKVSVPKHAADSTDAKAASAEYAAVATPPAQAEEAPKPGTPGKDCGGDCGEDCGEDCPGFAVKSGRGSGCVERKRST